MSVLNDKVLVVNSGFQPIRIITVLEAVKDLMNGKVEVVDEWSLHDFQSWHGLSELKHELDEADSVIRSTNSLLCVPKVVRARTNKINKDYNIRLNRKNLYLRDNFTCQYTGIKLPSSELNIDHIIPSSRGGKSTWDNLVCCSIEVNQKKGNKTPEEAGLTLIRKPRKPTSCEILLNGVKKMPQEWRDFVSEAYWEIDISEKEG